MLWSSRCRPCASETSSRTPRCGPTRRASIPTVWRSCLPFCVAEPESIFEGSIFVSATGGISATEPSTDLALALAVTSAATEVPLPANLVALGEVGLAGELRQVPQMGRRLTEAARLGFSRALVPSSTPEDSVAHGG